MLLTGPASTLCDMNRNRTILLGASALAAGAIVAGGVNLATAATGDGGSTDTYSRPPGPGGHEHTTVTGDEKTKVVDAVEARYDDVTVTAVLQDPDGSYDVQGTQGGNPVMVEVSKDLATVELRTGGPGGPGGPGGGFGGPGGPGPDTAVTGAEKTKVVDAVEAKYDDVTISDVREDPDGSYDALGTQDSNPVFVDVSKDLTTIELRTGFGHGPGGPPPPPGAPGAPEGGDSQSASPSSTT
jgi:hypothetical protein